MTSEDYDDLPTEHKPVLPPKHTPTPAVNHSMANLSPSSAATSAMDPVQLILHSQIMSKSACQLPVTTTTTTGSSSSPVKSPKPNSVIHDPEDYDIPVSNKRVEYEDYDEPRRH